MKSIDIMNYHILVWKICGIWPPLKSNTVSFVCYTIYSFALFNIIYVIFPFLIVLNLLTVTDINEVIETLLPLSTIALASVKGFLVYRNRNKLRQLFKVIEQLDAGVQTTEQRKIIDAAIMDSRKLSVLLSCLYYGGVNSAFLLVFLNKKQVLMWPSWTPFPYENSSTLYNALIFYQYIGSMFAALIDTSLDVYGSSLNILLEGHFNVLGIRLNNLGFDEKLENCTNSIELNKKMHENNLKDCAKYHKLCISISRYFDDILSFHYFLQFGTSGLIICVSAFELSILSPMNDFSKFLFVCEYIFSMTIQILIPCYFGTLVTNKSNQLPKLIYHSNWSSQSSEFKSSMRIFTERALKPVVPFAGGLFIIGLSTFISILRTAYSLLAFLKSFQ